MGYKATALKVIKELFDDSEYAAAITYKHYLGVTQVAGENVDSWQQFTATALTGKGRKFTTIEGEVRSSAGKRRFMIRESELPTGLDGADLTKNDKIVYAGDTLDVSDIKHIEGFVIWVEVEGG